MNRVEKINFMRSLTEKGAKIITTGDSFEEILEDCANTITIFFFSKNSKLVDSNAWEKNCLLFTEKLQEKSKDHKLYAVDCDVHEKYSICDGLSYIQVYHDGEVVIQNLLLQQHLSAPLSGNNRRVSRIDINKIEKTLEKSSNKPSINILLLGETGVGKSTWINGFANFVTYNSLACAEQGNLYTVIPSEFSVCDSNFEEVTIQTGQDQNEVFQAGQSATQVAKVHEFTVNNTIIRLIDTPGIGDTRGIQQDKINFQSILETVSNFQELHGICVLLKPNNSRLTVMFRFCIKELLTYLHKDAAKNIVFCFTNCRSTFYRPGDTMPALKTLLQENHEIGITINSNIVYCYDSEAYRFLAALKNDPPVEFSQDEKSNFAASWDLSTSEVKRLLDHFSSLQAHSIQSTLNLNHTRELVLKLSRPLAEVTRNIQTNRAILEDQRNEIQNTELNIQQLNARRMTTITQIEVIPLQYPRTVCSNQNCVKIWGTSDANVKTTEYVTICHDFCSVNDVPRDSLGSPGLMKCSAFEKWGPNKCNVCSHSYREHLHIYYNSKQVVKQIEDSAVNIAMQNGENAAVIKENLIEQRNKLIRQYESELKIIKDASVQFAHFLKTNAITPYNDDLEQYLNHLIREEEMKADSENSQTLAYLKQNLASYLEEKVLFETVMSNSSGKAQVTKPSSIAKLVDELTSLELSGPSIRDAINYVDSGRKAVYNKTIVSSNIRLGMNGFLNKLDELLASKLSK